MKFCYLDETGTGQETVVIVVGIVVDVQRMNRTKLEWQGLFERISGLANKPILELHAKDLLPGNHEWRDIDKSIRFGVVDAVLDWLATRKHKIVYSCVDKALFQASTDLRKLSLSNEWLATSFHVVLMLQKALQKEEKNKGNTVLIFDAEKNASSLVELVRDPPSWSDSYYARSKKKESLSQVVDAPFFVDSKHVELIQIPDLIGYILRRYSEINDYGRQVSDIEKATLDGWISKVRGILVPSSVRYLKRNACETAHFYNSLAPKSLRDL